MKVSFTEHAGCFSLVLCADTMIEAAALTRFGMNGLVEPTYCEAAVNESGMFEASVVWQKHKRSSSTIPHRGRRR